MTEVATPPPTGKLSFGRVVQGTFGVVGRNLPTLLILTVGCLAAPAVIIGLGVVQIRAGAEPGGMGLIVLGYLVLVAGTAVLQPAMIHAAVADLNGRRTAAGECLRTGLRHALPVFLILLLTGVAVGFGLVLLVVPGVMMLLAWLVAGPSQVVERTGVFGAFTRSGALTKGSRWRILGLLALYLIVYSVVQQVLLNLAGVGAGAVSASDPFAAFSTAYWVILLLLTVAHSVVVSVGLAVIYYELRRVKEGVGPEALAAVFD